MSELLTCYQHLLPHLCRKLLRVGLINVMDVDGILIVAQQNQWRVENVIDGLGIDAHEALSHCRYKATSPEQKEAVLRAIVKQFTSLLLGGTFRRDPQGRKDRDVPSKEKLPVQLLITQKQDRSMKARCVGLGNREIEGRDYDKNDLSMSMPDRGSANAFYHKAAALRKCHLPKIW